MQPSGVWIDARNPNMTWFNCWWISAGIPTSQHPNPSGIDPSLYNQV